MQATARISSGFAPLTGTIAFSVYAPGDTTCTTALTPPPTTPSPYTTLFRSSGNFTTAAVGTYRWRAFFTDGTTNNNVSTPCNDTGESSTVNAATPTGRTNA